MQEWQDDTGGHNPDYDEKRYASYPPTVHAVLRRLNEHVINLELIVELLLYIDAELDDGAVLIFLPGAAEIEEMMSVLVGVLATPEAHPRRRARFFFEVVAMRRSGLFAKKNIERV